MARTRASVFIHPLAAVDPGTTIGTGTRVWQFSVIKKGASIGKSCNIGSHCYVEWGARIGENVTIKNGVSVWEGVHLEDGVFVGPNAIFTNDVYPRSQRLPESELRYRNPGEYIVETHVQRGATIGAGATILAGVTIGRFAMVGLGAVVVRSVEDYALVVGAPAKRIGWICECGLPLPKHGSRLVCKECKKIYQPKNQRLRRLP